MLSIELHTLVAMLRWSGALQGCLHQYKTLAPRPNRTDTCAGGGPPGCTQSRHTVVLCVVAYLAPRCSSVHEAGRLGMPPARRAWVSSGIAYLQVKRCVSCMALLAFQVFVDVT